MSTSTSNAPSLTVSFIWTLAGPIFYNGCQWALLVLIAKLASPSLLGEYAFAAAVAYPISLIANFQLRKVFISDLEGRYPFQRMLGVRYFLAALAWLVLLLVCVVTHSTGRTTVLVLLVGTALLLDTLSEAYYSLLQKYDRMDRIGQSQTLRSCISLAASAATFYLTRNLVYALCGMLLGRLVVLIAYDAASETFRIVRINSEGREELPNSNALIERFRPHWHFKLQKEMLWVALPIGIVSIVLSYSGNIPRYIIEHHLGPHELGIYSALNYLPQTATMLAVTLGNVTYAKLSRLYYARDVRGFRILIGKNALICVGLGSLALIGTALAGGPILRILYRPEYAEHTDLLMWLVGSGAVACLASCVSWGMGAAYQFRPQLPLFLVVCTVSAGTAYLLVPRLGLQGAAIASLAAMTVQTVGASYIVHRALKERMTEILPEASAPEGANALASES